MFIYVTFDSNGFVTDYKKVETDGYTKVFVLDSWINQFAYLLIAKIVTEFVKWKHLYLLALKKHRASFPD